MSVVINTNVDSLRIQNNLTSATDGLSKSMRRMSSGLKIISSADDAAGTVISARMAVQLDGNKICQNNVQNANAMLSTAEGNIDVVLDNVSRIRDLTLQAKNGTYSEEEIAAMQDEVTQRIAEINRISNSSKYSQLQLFGATETDGITAKGLNADGATFQVGANATKDDVIAVDKGIFSSVEFLDLIADNEDAEQSITSIENFKGSFASATGDTGATKVIGGTNGENLEKGQIYYNSAEKKFYINDSTTSTASWVEYTGFDVTTATVVKDKSKIEEPEVGQIVNENGKIQLYCGEAAGWSEVTGANQYNIKSLLSSDITTLTVSNAAPAGDADATKAHCKINSDGTYSFYVQDSGTSWKELTGTDAITIDEKAFTYYDSESSATNTAGNAIKVKSGSNWIYKISTGSAWIELKKEAISEEEAAEFLSDFDLTKMSRDDSNTNSFASAVNALDQAIDDLTARKSLIGSTQNRLESALDALTTQYSNLSSAKSLITDADVASEASSFTQNQILQQVSTSLLAQANQAPSIALSII